MENELSRVVDALPGLVWTALPDGHIDFLNQRWCEYTGLSVEEGHGRGWQAAIHREDLPALLERWQSILASGEPGEMEARLRRLDGEYRWFLIRSCPLAHASGQVVKWCGLSTDIEDRRQAEETERARWWLSQPGRESHFRSIVDGLPALVILMAPDGELEHANRHCLDFFGATLEELKGRGQVHSYHPDDRPTVLAAWRKSLETGTPYESEGRRLRADGVYRWFHTRGFPLRDAEGRIVLWYSLAADIDDRKRAEEALQASERNLSLTINTIPALAWSARPDGSAEFFNQHYLDYVGLTADQAQYWDFSVAAHPDDLTRLTSTWRAIMASGEPGETEARLRRFDGEYRWFLFRANPLRNESGNVVKWYGTNTDIDDRKRAEERLRRNEAYLAEAQRVSQTGSFGWNVSDGEHFWSEETFRILEYDLSTKVTLQSILDRVHPQDLPLAKQAFALATVGWNLDYEFRFLMPSGALKRLHIVAHGTRSQDGRLEFIGAVQDVTERRLSEEALGKVRSELAHMARVTSLGALTASIAHEVNQPLSGIITNASTCLRMLAADPPNVAGARETARRTIRDGNRASDVITRLRALFTQKDFTSEAVDLNEAAREVIALSSSDLQRSRAILQTELDKDLPPVVGDRVQLQQVILNLLLNASEAMSCVDDRPRQLVVRTEREEGDRARLTVQDAGVGLDPQSADRLFEAFYTTKRDGMGIGLSVSRSIIESHGGRLWAAPNDGPGATFAFSIPRSPDRSNGNHSSGAFRVAGAADTQYFMRSP